MVTCVSNPLYLEVLEGAITVGPGLEIDIYDAADPATMLATLENSSGRSFTWPMNDLGAGQFDLPESDAKNTAEIIRKGNLVKCKVAGVYRFAWWMDDLREVVLSEAEGGGKVIHVAGRGAPAYLEQAIVYPPVWPPRTVAYRFRKEATGTGDLTFTGLSGLKAGDILYAGIVTTGGSDASVSATSSGWEEVSREDSGNDLAMALFQLVVPKVLPTTAAFEVDGTTRPVAGVMVGFRGVNKDEVISGSLVNPSSATITAPTLEPSLVNSISVGFFGTKSNTSVSAPTDYTERGESSTTGLTVSVSTRDLATSLTPTGNITAPAGAAAVNIGMQVLVAPSNLADASYTGQTWGAILEDQLAEAQTRGAIPFLQHSFTAALDSGGAVWTEQPVLSFSPGTTQMDVWRKAVGMGLDTFVDTDLYLHVYEEYARHREQEVVLRAGYHLLGGLDKVGKQQEIKTRLLVQGAGGLFFEVHDPALEADPDIGRREGYLSFPDSGDPTTMQRAGESTLEALTLDTEGLSVPVRHGLGDGQYEPWVDYRLGDWISLDVPGKYDMAPYRVAAISVEERDGGGYDVTLDLSSLQLEYLTRLRRMLDDIGGSTGSNSGTAAGALSVTTQKPAAGGMASAPGDTPGYLYDKIAAGVGLAKKLIGSAPSQQVELRNLITTLSDLLDVDVTTTPPTDGQALVWDDALGLWVAGDVAAGGGGGGGGYTLLEEIVVTTPTPTITFDAIPATYKDLRIVAVARVDRASGVRTPFHVRVGKTTVDTAAHYRSYVEQDFGGGATARLAETADTTVWQPVRNILPGTAATAGRMSSFDMTIFDYARIGQHRLYLAAGGVIPNNTTSDFALSRGSGFWTNTTDAIDIITLVEEAAANFVAGSTFRLYGAGPGSGGGGGGGATNLDGLTDVDTTTVPPTDGQGLVFDLASGLWKPGTVAAGAIDWGETGDITTAAFSDAPAAGVLDETARADHRHGMPAAPSGGGSTITGTAWTPVLTAATTNPTLGTGSAVIGRYTQIGNMVYAYGEIKFGTAGVAAGTGNYRVSLPVAARAQLSTTGDIMGHGFVLDASAAILRWVGLSFVTTTTVQLRVIDGSSLVNGASPWAWDASDVIEFQIIYEAATSIGGAPVPVAPVPTLMQSVKAAADTPDDDFNGGTLDAKWVAVDGTAGTVTLLAGAGAGVYDLASRPGWVMMQVGTALTDNVELRQDYTLPDGKCIVAYMGFVMDNSAALATGNEFWGGIGVNDNDAGPFSGTAAQTAHVQFDTDDPAQWRIIGLAATAAGNAIGTSPTASGATPFGGVFFRIDRSGLNYDLFWSADGFTWNYVGRKTMATPANNVWLWARSQAGAGIRQVVGCPWFRQGTALAIDPWPL